MFGTAFRRERFLKRGVFLLLTRSIFVIMLLSPAKGIAMSCTFRPEENLQNIRRQLDDEQRTLNTLKMRPRESLRDFEYRVKRHSDKILSLKVAEQVQQQQIDQEAREAEEQLKKKSP